MPTDAQRFRNLEERLTKLERLVSHELELFKGSANADRAGLKKLINNTQDSLTANIAAVRDDLMATRAEVTELKAGRGTPAGTAERV